MSAPATEVPVMRGSLGVPLRSAMRGCRLRCPTASANVNCAVSPYPAYYCPANDIVGKHVKAAIAFRVAMDLNEHLGNREAYAAGLYGLAHLWADEGRRNEALQFGQVAIEILKPINFIHVIEVE